MREAVGGTLLTYIIIPIIILLIVFIAFIMNYASAYRAANYIVTQIETCNANMGGCSSDGKDKNLDTIKEDVKNKYGYIGDINYCCYDNAKGSVYKTTVYVAFDLPMWKQVPVFSVKSESKTIYGVSCSERSAYFSTCQN